MSEDFTPVISLPSSGVFHDYVELLKKGFGEEYRRSPTFATRAPGRVNIIGEHIDYCGYAVLPMALDQHVVIVVGLNDTQELRIANRNSAFRKYSCGVDRIKINKSEPQWHNYILCGVRGILEHFVAEDPVGMDLYVDGDIPPSAGLSSSSALVCAAALAALHANGLKMSKSNLAALCARSERYVGTEGGGMDQAIAFLAEPGTAKLIQFNPIRTEDVHLPATASFVIANSCVDINKAATSDFNTRVVECRLAAQILAKQNGLEWKKYLKLGDVQVALQVPLSKMPSLIKDVFHQNPYSREEVRSILDISEDVLLTTILSTNTSHLQKFHLFQRAMHVYTEAARVWEFKRLCEEKSSDILQKLGNLMNESHASCRDLYECSHPDLDKLVEISINAGAVGSRLTGAGWGGCSVSFVPKDKSDTFLENVHSNFYEKICRKKNSDNCLFRTQPGNGAETYTF